jgi:hypothetical protein
MQAKIFLSSSVKLICDVEADSQSLDILFKSVEMEEEFSHRLSCQKFDMIYYPKIQTRNTILGTEQLLDRLNVILRQV